MGERERERGKEEVGENFIPILGEWVQVWGERVEREREKEKEGENEMEERDEREKVFFEKVSLKQQIGFLDHLGFLFLSFFFFLIFSFFFFFFFFNFQFFFFFFFFIF